MIEPIPSRVFCRGKIIVFIRLNRNVKIPLAIIVILAFIDKVEFLYRIGLPDNS